MLKLSNKDSTAVFTQLNITFNKFFGYVAPAFIVSDNRLSTCDTLVLV